jgi:hypothetical protein
LKKFKEKKIYVVKKNWNIKDNRKSLKIRELKKRESGKIKLNLKGRRKKDVYKKNKSRKE